MESSLFALTDRVALVTGSGRGIGKAIALGLADAGADVVVAARTVSEIESTASEIRAKGRRALAVPTDTRDSEQVSNLVHRTVQKMGSIDILVNNAGGTFAASFLDISERAWDAVMSENLRSTFLCIKAVGQEMVNRGGGNIINVSSMAGLGPWPRLGPYASAKAGIISLTQSLAVEWAPYHVRVNAIAPGFIVTRGTKEYLGEAQLRRIPLRRFGEPEDIAGAAIYLASRASDYVTGATIVINGGLTTLVD